MKNKRILFVEDNETYRNMLSLRLKDQGYDVLPAGDGLEGYNLAKRHNPDLIILDYMIPEMDGCQVCRLIKFDKKLQNIPILMLTCKNLAADVEAAMKVHVDAFIIKDTPGEVLMETVRRLLEQSPMV